MEILKIHSVIAHFLSIATGLRRSHRLSLSQIKIEVFKINSQIFLIGNRKKKAAAYLNPH